MSSISNHGPKIALSRNTGGSSPVPSGNSAFIVEETGHGYITANLPLAMFHTSTGWEEARADSESTLATHVMVTIVDANHYTLAQSGRFEIVGHGLTVNNYYFVSDVTSGKFIPGEPTEFSNPLLFVESVDYIHVLPFRPSVIGEVLAPEVAFLLQEIQTLSNRIQVLETIEGI